MFVNCFADELQTFLMTRLALELIDGAKTESPVFVILMDGATLHFRFGMDKSESFPAGVSLLTL
jgi:hypothetical protein